LDKKAHTTFNDEKETVKYIILNEIVRYFSLTIIASWYVGPFIKLLGPTTFLMDYGPTAGILNKKYHDKSYQLQLHCFCVVVMHPILRSRRIGVVF
jgi:hypothetical protein